MEKLAITKHVRISPYKAREVARLIQGKTAVAALNMVSLIPRKAARLIAKTLASAIANAAPAMDGKDIHFVVGHLAQKEWINRNCRPRMEAFLQKQFADREIRLIVDVKEAKETGRGMYMPSDKAKFLQESSPEFNALRKDFELEIS